MAEPGFVDGPENAHRWGNVWMIPLLVTLMCVGFAVAESIVERSTKKAWIRGGLALPLGVVLGFIFSGMANVFYSIGLNICFQAGVRSFIILRCGSRAELPGWCLGPRVEWSTASLASL